MKSKILFLTVGMLSLSDSAYSAMIFNQDGTKLDFNGSMRGRHYFSNASASNGDFTYGRIGFKGETRINDSLIGYGLWEYNIQANNSEVQGPDGDKTRYGLAGLKFGRWGSIDYGRSNGVMFDVGYITDQAPIFDILTDNYTDGFMTGRASGLLTYQNHSFFGLNENLSFSLQAQGANKGGSATSERSVYAQNGEGKGASVTYNFDWDGSLMAAYEASKRTDSQNQLAMGKGDYAEMWAIGFKYNPGGANLGVKLSQGHNITPIKGYGYANITNNFEAYFKYIFNNGIAPGVGYFQSKARNLEGYSSIYLTKYSDISLAYFFNKNMFTYADYKLNLLNHNTPFNISHDDIFGIGLTYQF